jgi:hypothetical protein
MSLNFSEERTLLSFVFLNEKMEKEEEINEFKSVKDLLRGLKYETYITFYG